MKIRILAVFLPAVWMPASMATGQDAPPGTDIFLAPLTLSESTAVVGEPVNITLRPGYDNQPCFSPDGESLLFTSIRDEQADTYRYQLDRKKIQRVTRTRESEYSPTFMPVTTEFSVVQVEADSVQRLWAFSSDGKSARLLLEPVKTVGYHVWIDRNRVGLFVLGKPHRLEIADLRSGRTIPMARDIGRCLARVPAREVISFMQRSEGVEGEEWWIKTLDPETGGIETLVRAVPGSQDYVWAPDGSLLMARESRIFRWRGEDAGTWTEIAVISDPALARISRLAVSPEGNLLALVAEEPVETAPKEPE